MPSDTRERPEAKRNAKELSDVEGERSPVSVQLVGALIFGAFLLAGTVMTTVTGSAAWVIGLGVAGALAMVLVQLAILRRRHGSLDQS
jgi:hypothetical protein